MGREDFTGFRHHLRELGRELTENLLVLRRVNSTNELARRVLESLPAEAYPPEPTLVVAYEQTRGRGRLDRAWTSAAGGGLYCTLLLGLPGRQAPQRLPMAVAVALCRALRGLDAPCELKWPNDLMLAEGKLGGVLVEIVAPPGGGRATAIIGFGINLAGGALELPPGAATLPLRGGRQPTAAEVLAVVAPALRELPAWIASPFELAAAYRDLVRHRAGDPLRWRQGDEEVEGSYAGIDDEGRLILDTAGGRRLISVGDIMES